MMRKISLLFFIILFAMVCTSFAQTRVAVGYNFDTSDTLLAEFGSIRCVAFDDDLLGDGVSAIAATNYNENGVIHVFRTVGNDEIELMWTSPPYQTYVPGPYNPYHSNPRHVVFGDLDNDGRKEVIFHRCYVGIEIWEWDGVPGSYNFGTVPSQTIDDAFIAHSTSSTEYCEFLEVDDYDNDNYQELAIAYNSGVTNDNDNYYIFEAAGGWSTNSPGFSTFREEFSLARTFTPNVYGLAGSPIAMFGCDLDGDGDKDLIIHNWNYKNVVPLMTVGPDEYQLPDTNSTKGHIYLTHANWGVSETTSDRVSLDGGMALDVDGDGREEAYLPTYGGLPDFGNLVHMIHYQAGENLLEIDSNNVVVMDISIPESEVKKSCFGQGYGDIDGNGRPNLYFGQSYSTNVVTAEFQGGDKTDPANWTASLLYAGDSTIYNAMDITVDSAAVANGTGGDTSFTVETGFVANLYARYTDFDKDGFEDIILPYQTVIDSIPVTKETWTDSLESVIGSITPDTTIIPGEPPDTVITFDTTYVPQTYWEKEDYKVLNPKRWSLRIIEGTQSLGIVAKDIKVITPKDYVLNQNYPNPFNPETTIEFILPVNKRISLTIYNALGQKIKTLVDNQFLKAGRYEKVWNATNEAGHKVATGMYIYTLKYGNFSKSKKMMLMK